MIDHENYLFHFHISQSTYYLLLQDMHRFNMYKSRNGEKTINMNFPIDML